MKISELNNFFILNLKPFKFKIKEGEIVYSMFNGLELEWCFLNGTLNLWWVYDIYRCKYLSFKFHKKYSNYYEFSIVDQSIDCTINIMDNDYYKHPKYIK